jgi:hypothetical protein
VEKHVINSKIMARNSEYRRFKEFDQIKEGEIYVTIEYW